MLGPGVRASPSTTNAKANNDGTDGMTHSAIAKNPSHHTGCAPRAAYTGTTHPLTLYRSRACTADRRSARDTRTLFHAAHLLSCCDYPHASIVPSAWWLRNLHKPLTAPGAMWRCRG